MNEDLDKQIKQIVEQHARMEMILVRLLQMCKDADHSSGNGTISARLVREYALEGLAERPYYVRDAT